MAIIPGSAVVPVPQQVAGAIAVSNRIVRFVVDGKTHFGTGILVGPAQVLTAAHLFFDRDGQLDRSRLNRITVELRTTRSGSCVVEGTVRTTRLDMGDDDPWLVDPTIDHDVTQRDVNDLDFAIVQLEEAVGNDSIGGGETRKSFDIPTAAMARVLAPGTVIRVFQYLDRGDLLTSGGIIRDVTVNRMRVLHSASTAGSASGAAIVDDHFNLLAIHLAGPPSAEFPLSNLALPIRRVAEVIDDASRGATIRSRLK